MAQVPGHSYLLNVKIKAGELEVGEKFTTIRTGRRGIVKGISSVLLASGTRISVPVVCLTNPVEWKSLHPDVAVELVRD